MVLAVELLLLILRRPYTSARSPKRTSVVILQFIGIFYPTDLKAYMVFNISFEIDLNILD